MIKEFDKLREEEVELMIKAPLLACILIAGADGTIDRKEIREAIAFVQANKGSSQLSEYFKELSQDFEDKLKVLIQGYPYESSLRNPLIEKELSGLNTVWPKLHKDFAATFYRMLKRLSERIASSSGGLWGIRTVAIEEARYLSLPMIADPSK